MISPTPQRDEPTMTAEQQSALTMLFAAHADKDPLRIKLAEEHLEFLVHVQGIWRLWEKRRAA